MRRLLAAFASCALVCVGTVVVTEAPAVALVPRKLNGRVTCSNGASVVGIWVDVPGDSGDRWASRRTVAESRSTALYTVNLNVQSASTVKLTVGCGGSKITWASSNSTPRRNFNRSETFNASCTGKVPNGSCIWTAAGPEWPPLRVSALVGCGDHTYHPACDPSPYHTWSALDFGVDKQPVYATGPGTVSTVGSGDERGRFVMVKHTDGRSSRYLHLSKVEVAKGKRVIAGTRLGVSGSSGLSTYPHLHYDEFDSNGNKASLGSIYSWGAAISGSPDRTGYRYPLKCGKSTWAAVPGFTCTVRVGA